VVDKLRKLGAWIWLNKERMILIAMVVFLVYRVWQVVYPPPPVEGLRVVSPKNNLPEDPQERATLVADGVLPPPPPPRELTEIPGTYAVVHRNNAMWYYSGDTGTTTEVTAESLGLYLVDIQRAGTRLRARLQTRSTTKWYNEGEQFEEFELLQIDQEQGTVEIYANQHGTRLTVKMQR
jgi:hypothetical protein